jgi:ABC-type phosphate transport system substrate-binding protein
VRTPFLVVASLVLAAGAGAETPSSRGFKVVVNAAVPGTKVPRAVLAQIYLGNAQRWGDGRPIVAVDLSSTSRVRKEFSESVLQMPIMMVQQYWLREVSSVKRPPRTKETDDDVIAFVAAEAGAVGYVSEATAVPPTVHVLTVE